MNSKINVHNFWRSHTFIIFMFAVMSVISAAFMWHSKYVYVGADLYFHWQRIYDLRTSILNGNWNPLIALNRFHQTGTAIMSLYPKINLYPLVFLTFIFKSFVRLYYITFILRNFFALIVAYVASFSYNRSKKISFIFSITYTLTPMVIFHAIQDYDLGISSSLIFIPLVMFGFMELARRNRWIELTIGMSLIILCHVLNAAIISLFLLAFAVMNYSKFMDRKKLLSLIKAIITTLLLTSVFLIPFITIMRNNSISMPVSFWGLSGNSFNSLLSAALENNVDGSINLAMLLGLILGIINYKKLSSLSKQLLWIATGFIIICSNLFPWDILQHTFLNNVLQFTFRLYVVPEVILAYLFAEVIIDLCKNKKQSNIVVVLIVLATMLLQMGAQESIVNNSLNYANLKQNNYLLPQKMKISTNHSFNKLIHNTWGISDYYPASAFNKLHDNDIHLANYGKNKKLTVKSKGNGKFIFSNKKSIKKFSLPFLYYKGINYQVKLDGKTVKGYPNKSALMTINNVHKGKHHVQIIVHKTKAEIVSYILSLTGLLILIGTILKNFLKKRKIG